MLSKRTKIEYTVKGLTEVKIRGLTRSLDPVIEDLLRRGYEILDRRAYRSSFDGKSSQSFSTLPASRMRQVKRKITLQIPVRKNQICLAMFMHPYGGITWHFPKKFRKKTKSSIITISIARPVYYRLHGIKRDSSPGNYILLVLATSFAATLARKGMSALAKRWEKKYADYGLFRVDERGVDEKAPLKFLPHHQGKRGLLLLHGTFSSAASGFYHLFHGEGKEFFRKLLESYSGRIIGFDHPTISASPDENAKWLLAHIESGHTCAYDILAHSRGGLVARSLVESIGNPAKKSRASRRLLIDRVIFVGVPNRGTPLVPAARRTPADSYAHFATWLGNIASILPGKMLPYAIDFLAEILKYLGAGIRGTLPGLSILSPESDFLKKLNRPSSLGGAIYYAMVGNFEAPQKFMLKLADAGLDMLFHGEENDFAVSASSARGADSGIPDRRFALFSPFAAKPSLKTNVNHFGYFKTKKCLKTIGEFLGLPPERTEKQKAGSGKVRGDVMRHAASIGFLHAPPMREERPEFTTPLPSLDVAVIGDERSQRTYREWLKKWKKGITEAKIKELPPEPFPMLIAVSGLSRAVSVFKTRGEDTYWHSLIGTERSMRRYLQDAGPELSLDRLKRAGAMLYKTLFSGDAGRILNRTILQAPENTPVLITFTTTSPWIADFPWEMIFDPAKKRFLSLGEVCVFRGVLSTEAAVTLPALPLVIRMLIAAAQPKDQLKLNVESEVKGLKAALSPLIENRRLYIDVLEHTSAESLKSKLKRTRYHILHYIGHGDYDESADTGKLIFEKPRSGLSSPVEADELCELLLSYAPHLRLILLNGCETAEGGKADFNRGTAPALVAGGIPCVVGNRLIVGDEAAVTFATIFYRELSHRRSLAEAIMTARRVLASSPHFEPYEWAVPIIFAIDPEARFF